jgi:hypothetical protein
LRDAADLGKNPVRLTSSYDERHPYVMAGVRVAVGVWLIVLFALLGSIGDWWGAVLLLPAAISIWIGGRVFESSRKKRPLAH